LGIIAVDVEAKAPADPKVGGGFLLSRWFLAVSFSV
jgi:hypothetical protein